MNRLQRLQQEIAECRRCPRLVEWRERVARDKKRAYATETYWGRPVPGFGDPRARLLIVGLAPAAHGANRTGRMFTGDSSGDWLYRALHRAGFASQASSRARGDGLALADAYVTASARCAPPDNKPLPGELAACRPFVERELAFLPRVAVVVALGRIAFDTVLRVPAFGAPPAPRPAFAHGVELPLDRGARARPLVLVGSYHPSRQNTNTRRLTEPMLDAIFARARELVA